MTREGWYVPTRGSRLARLLHLWADSACLLTYPLSLLQMNGLAAQGRYEGSGDGGAAAQSLYVANHAY